jgi:hypothetical protein
MTLQVIEKSTSEERCRRFTNMPRKSSCSVWQKRTAHDTSRDDDDGGWKEARENRGARKQLNQTQFKLRLANLIRATVSQLCDQALSSV